MNTAAPRVRRRPASPGSKAKAVVPSVPTKPASTRRSAPGGATPEDVAQAAAPPTAGEPLGPAPDAARVLRQFRIVFNAVRTHFQQVERQAGIGGAKIWALSLVVAHPDIGVGALARAMDIHQTTASNLVRSLSSGGLIATRRTAADRRSVSLRATPAGRRLLAKSPGPFAGVLPEALELLPPDCLLRLEADLDRLIDTLHADPKAGDIPLAEM